MNKQEKRLLTKLFWHLQRNKNTHHIIYSAQETLASILKKEYGIADKLLDRLSWGQVPPPLVTRGTPIRYEKTSDKSKRYKKVSDDLSMPRIEDEKNV